MGKDLKGRELGEGVYQRKDGKYIARYRSQDGKRPEKSFFTFIEAVVWLSEQKGLNNWQDGLAIRDMTMDEWFIFWKRNLKTGVIKDSTMNTYDAKYKHISYVMGDMNLTTIRPIHCQKVITKMFYAGKKDGTINGVKTLMKTLFSSAIENGIIKINPVSKSITWNKRPKEEARVLTVEEQAIVLKELEKHFCNAICTFIMQTGLRCGEASALVWDDIDWDKMTVNVNKTYSYNSKTKSYEITPPKTMTSYRTIPLTSDAYDILVTQYYALQTKKWEKAKRKEYREHIFLTNRGTPYNSSVIDHQLKSLCLKNSIYPFSVHTLRHTFATRCIEAGMKPKTLQKILGHSSVNITMNLYVHVTSDEMESEIEKFTQRYQEIVSNEQRKKA